MPSHPQDEPFDLSNDVGPCRGCGQRRVLCAFGQCVQCHDASKTCCGPEQEPGELCCGWWRTGTLEADWQCPSCGRVVPTSHGTDQPNRLPRASRP